MNHVRIGWSWDDVHQVWCLIEDGAARAVVCWSAELSAELGEGWTWRVERDARTEGQFEDEGTDRTFEDACARAELALSSRRGGA